MRSFLSIYLFILCLLFTACGDSKKSEQEGKGNGNSAEVSEEEKKDKIILFFGDSLTAGYGLVTEEAFPALIQQKIDSLDLPYKVVNAGLSGETTAGGKNRIEWVLKQRVDIFVLELGANDGLRGVPLSETRKNLQEIIDIVKSQNSGTEIILAGMQIPPNLGTNYTSEFRNIFPELASKNNVHLIPFLLDDVAGNPEFNQQDGIHPTAEGQEVLAKNVWEVLEPILKE